MIQRIQTLFLLVAAICYALLFVFPLKEINADNVHVPVYAYSAFNKTFSYTATFSVVSGFIFIGLAATIAAILTFKQRYLQIRLCYVLVFLSLASLLLLHFTQSVEHYGSAEIKSWKALVFFSLIAITSFMASIFIKKDINLLKSANRIR